MSSKLRSVVNLKYGGNGSNHAITSALFQDGILRGALLNLIQVLLKPNPDVVIGLFTFEGRDAGSSYLRQQVAPTISKTDVMNGVNHLKFSRNIGEVSNFSFVWFR